MSDPNDPVTITLPALDGFDDIYPAQLTVTADHDLAEEIELQFTLPPCTPGRRNHSAPSVLITPEAAQQLRDALDTALAHLASHRQ